MAAGSLTAWPGPRMPRLCEWIADLSVPGLEVDLSNMIEDFYGEWSSRVRQPARGGSASVSWRGAEDCAALEFVPEPGTIMLLGSGLAGLAGYATLRLRSGQALRWRTRE